MKESEDISARVEERIEDIIDELDNKLIRWSTEESAEWGAWRIGVRDGLLAAQSQSVEERMYTEEEMREAVLFVEQPIHDITKVIIYWLTIAMIA